MRAKLIKISDKKDGYLSFDLREILETIEPEGAQLKWSILRLDGIGFYQPETTMVDVSRMVETSATGLQMTWEELVVLAQKTHQVYDGDFMGCRDEKRFRRYKVEQEQFEASDIFIEAFDSSYWRVYSKEPSVIKRLSQRFSDIELF